MRPIHGLILRRHGIPLLPGAHFDGGDPRLQHSLASLEPRVHFALVCGSRSCPPIAVYEPEAIDRQLDLATGAFVNDGGVWVDPRCGHVSLSRIFQWYGPDFGARLFAVGDRRPLLRFVEPYLEGQCAPGKNPRIDFQRYDWSPNVLSPPR